MNDENWAEFDDMYSENLDELSAHDRKSKGKAVRKRKWREIENIKEQRRSRREMEEYEQYSY
ncbi:DUF3545 family protein [Colwellia sp. D2M02]|nr:DUF3545 family protein [Colwellia sp. D2M02]MBU2894475.1 DUF3545 family protein [Colwellia sp. D2M02]